MYELDPSFLEQIVSSVNENSGEVASWSLLAVAAGLAVREFRNILKGHDRFYESLNPEGRRLLGAYYEATYGTGLREQLGEITGSATTPHDS